MLDRRPKSEYRSLNTEDGRRKTEDGIPKTEDGRPKTEDGRQKTEDGRRMTEVQEDRSSSSKVES
ncbi:MAG: hypothetical protein Q7U59_06975 [Lutibacter sp.]|nr:hypothetical protein [Lutibacter sp.]